MTSNDDRKDIMKTSENENTTEITHMKEVETSKALPNSKEKHVLSNDDLIEYIYQHIKFDEIPFDSDPLYDHRQIYSHETAHIEYGLYENIEALVAFSIHMHNEKESDNIEDKNVHVQFGPTHVCQT